jgi:hypothetical protein
MIMEDWAGWSVRGSVIMEEPFRHATAPGRDWSTIASAP